MSSTEVLGVAIIGYGGMGRSHVKRVSNVEELQLIGVYDILPERNALAREEGVFAFDTFEEVLADPRVSIATVAIPNDRHKDICIRLMRAGKNVICEKPVTLSSAELQEMIDVSKECGVIFTVHQNRRWDKDYRIMKEIFDNGTLGRTFRVESRVHGSRGIPGDWRNRKAQGGGMVLDWGIHLYDQMLQMMGARKLKSVFAKLSYVTNEECDDGFTVICDFEDDITFVVEVGTSNFISMPRWYMLGENGSAIIYTWDNTGKIVMVSDWEKRDAVPVETAAGLTKTMAPRTADTIKEYPLPDVQVDMRDYYRNVRKAVLGEEAQLIKHEELMRSMKLMEAVFRSAELNQSVPFEA